MVRSSPPLGKLLPKSVVQNGTRWIELVDFLPSVNHHFKSDESGQIAVSMITSV